MQRALPPRHSDPSKSAGGKADSPLQHKQRELQTMDEQAPGNVK